MSNVTQTGLQRWVHVAIASLAMVATLPGRTQGLGLFTEPILKSYNLTSIEYGSINLGATLLGALFCIPCGWLIDRLGIRPVLVGIMLLLSTSVCLFPILASGVGTIFLFILLTRGFGQSALSVGSLTLIGLSVGKRTGLAMGVYAVLMSIGFIVAFGVLREVIKADPGNWVTPWTGIGIGVFVAALISLVAVRHSALDDHRTVEHDPAIESRTLGQALRSGAFWVIAVGTSFYGMVAAGTSLYNESILAERGFSKEIFLTVVIIGILPGLLANLVGGWLATKMQLGRLFGMALLLFAGTLAMFPYIVEVWQIYSYAVSLAIAGGVITVCFFTAWRKLYGPAHLGRIQGVAQFLTVIFSASGPMLFAWCKTDIGDYATLFPYLAATALLLAIGSFMIRIPQSKEQQ